MEGNQTFTENMIFGDKNDVGSGTATTQMAKNMVIVKVKGDLTIDEGVTVSPYYTEYGGPKGFTLYVTGKLTNNGTIDNSHGAYAEGQNVYLWKNADDTYEYVPAVGGTGGIGVANCKGILGTSGVGRQTGGGGTGTGSKSVSAYNYKGGNGGNGTSYSGGSGGGGAYNDNTGGYGSNYGGSGGSPVGGNGTGSGAGNPSNGTGGLLIIYSDSYENNGILSANGHNASSASYPGGSSGGGSINIFYNIITNKGTTNVNGGTVGGAGGTGTVTYTQIN